ncbi:MAG: DNA-binding response regulator [Verrucomicrobiales bacterium]|nr:DNA-binding response regulator [Verrucomicrobiales bacterium]
MHRILLVEDDPTLLRGVSDNFANQGYLVEAAIDGESAAGRVDTLRFGSFHLDQDSRKLRERTKGWVKLSPKEYELLAFFLERRGQALSRDQIMSGVWGHDSRVTSRSIDRFVTQLRKVIETEQGQWIETIREYGYRYRPDSGEK